MKITESRGLLSASARQCEHLQSRSLNAILVAEAGRGLPLRFGNWHTIHQHPNESLGQGRCAGSSLRPCPIIRIKIEFDPVARTIVQWHRRAKKTARTGHRQARSRGGWTTKIHMVAADGSNRDNVLALARPQPRRAVLRKPVHCVHDHGRWRLVLEHAGTQARVNPNDRVMYR